jgi:hypothetical protein
MTRTSLQAMRHAGTAASPQAPATTRQQMPSPFCHALMATYQQQQQMQRRQQQGLAQGLQDSMGSTAAAVVVGGAMLVMVLLRK